MPRPLGVRRNNMPPTSNDGGCTQCHIPEGNALSVKDAHVHPMRKQDPFTLGLTASLDAVRDVNAVDPSVPEGFAFGMDGPAAGQNSIYCFESRSGWFHCTGPTFTLPAAGLPAPGGGDGRHGGRGSGADQVPSTSCTALLDASPSDVVDDNDTPWA